ncbi:hypothetical protein IMY05_015G0041800 [Salix suchowensis]|nr:hypothetical protein IMY05_015G0041800 [Salix suchowensis]
MKPIVFLLISWLTLLSLFTPTQATFPGGCGNNGSQQCLVDFLSNYGASSMPKNCVCKNAGSQRLCSCDVVCQ